MSSETLVIVVTGTKRKRQVVPQTPFIFSKYGSGGLFIILAGQAVGHLGFPPLSACSENVGVAYKGDKLGIEHQVRRLETPFVTDYRSWQRGHWGAEISAGIRARYGSAQRFGSVVHEAGLKRSDGESAGMGERELFALKTKPVGISGNSPAIRIALARKNVKGTQLSLVIVVALSAPFHIKSNVVIFIWSQCQPSPEIVIASIHRGGAALAYLNPVPIR